MEFAMQFKRTGILALFALALPLAAAGADPAGCSAGGTFTDCAVAPASASADDTAALADYLWIANDANYGVGTVSKVATQPFASGAKYRETARYASVTCLSHPVN